jgi:hypothetical protein
MSRSESTIGTTVTITTGTIAKTMPIGVTSWFSTGLIGTITGRTTECAGITGIGATLIQTATEEDQHVPAVSPRALLERCARKLFPPDARALPPRNALGDACGDGQLKEFMLIGLNH